VYIDFDSMLSPGDLVSHNSLVRGSPDTIGLVIKKRFKAESIKGERHNILTYEVLFSDGGVQCLRQEHLQVIQSVN
jgi:hypothetical protein